MLTTPYVAPYYTNYPERIPVMSITYKTPQIHSCKTKPWVKKIDSVDKNALNGYGYHGEFYGPDTLIEGEPGDILISSLDNGNTGIIVYIVAPVAMWEWNADRPVDTADHGKAVVRMWPQHVDGSGRRDWASALCVRVRELLAMSAEERLKVAQDARRKDRQEKLQPFPSYKTHATVMGVDVTEEEFNKIVKLQLEAQP